MIGGGPAPVSGRLLFREDMAISPHALCLLLVAAGPASADPARSTAEEDCIAEVRFEDDLAMTRAERLQAMDAAYHDAVNRAGLCLNETGLEDKNSGGSADSADPANAGAGEEASAQGESAQGEEAADAQEAGESSRDEETADAREMGESSRGEEAADAREMAEPPPDKEAADAREAGGSPLDKEAADARQAGEPLRETADAREMGAPPQEAAAAREKVEQVIGDEFENSHDSVPSAFLSGTELLDETEEENSWDGTIPEIPDNLDPETGARKSMYAKIRKPPMGPGRVPQDIPPADNDDALARQIRAAAEAESDPNKRKRLWNEYRKYKKLPPQS